MFHDLKLNNIGISIERIPKASIDKNLAPKTRRRHTIPKIHFTFLFLPKLLPRVKQINIRKRSFSLIIVV
jgi:hypothetical protein